MVKQIEALSIEEVQDVQLEGGEGGVDPIAEKRRQGWWCAGCCYLVYAAIFGGLIAKNFVQFIIFVVVEPNMWVYFWGMLVIMIAGCVLYCITGCCNAAGFAKFLDPTCMLVNLGFSIFGAAAFFGNPLLPVMAGQASADKLDVTQLSLQQQAGLKRIFDTIQSAARQSGGSFQASSGANAGQDALGVLFGEIYRTLAAFILLPLISSSCGCCCMMMAVAWIMSNPEKARENESVMANAFLASMAGDKGASPQ